jgi:hypothetical protein
MKQLNSLLPCLNRLRLFIATALVAIGLAGCEKDPEPLYDKGMIKGHIYLRTPDYENIDGDKVNVIAHGPYGNKSTTSDPNGRYTLSGLGNGTYEIEFYKTGYGIWRLPGQQVFGNDTLIISACLYQKIDYKMPSLTVNQLVINDYPTTVLEEKIRLFYSDTKVVNYKNYLYTEMTYTYEDESGKEYMAYNSNPQRPNYGPIFDLGQTMYIIGYVCNEDDPGYFNEYYNHVIYSTVDEHQHSAIFKITCTDQ